MVSLDEIYADFQEIIIDRRKVGIDDDVIIDGKDDTVNSIGSADNDSSGENSNNCGKSSDNGDDSKEINDEDLKDKVHTQESFGMRNMELYGNAQKTEETRGDKERPLKD